MTDTPADQTLPQAGTKTKPGTEPAKAIASASDATLDRILRFVHERKLRPGDQLPSEGDLAVECQVGRGTVREAVRALAQLGVLNVSNGRRAQVAEISGENLAILIDHAVKTTQVTVLQTWDLRQTIEARIVRLASLRRSPEQVEKMHKIGASMMANIDDLQALGEADINLHLCWAEAARNPLFLLNIQSLVHVMRWTSPVGWAAIGSRERITAHVELHHRISEAISDRRADDAVTWMQQHFEQAQIALIDSGIE
ncbi:FadR/GntR family transcriptional regulator [Devosia sp.]|uniref:FadR/GntR family transcriptional regulator n=1 Tax=Devosia sp. TaxID=1871048 RepID=UPI0037C0FDE4